MNLFFYVYTVGVIATAVILGRLVDRAFAKQRAEGLDLRWDVLQTFVNVLVIAALRALSTTTLFTSDVTVTVFFMSMYLGVQANYFSSLRNLFA